MLLYENPGGHNWGPPNFDGYGITTAIVAALYSIFFFYPACFYIWSKRNHPALYMRKISLAILSIQVLHVYVIMIFLAYMLNGLYPCKAEFWVMSIYLPIGIGLYQAQNQQLLLLSKGQDELLHHQDQYKPLLPSKNLVGRPRYWVSRFKAWWDSTSKQGQYEGYVILGMCVQFAVTTSIYCISRKFSGYGITSQYESPGQCRRGWEWIPSIAWQFLWNFCFGPYLLWKVRAIHDIYHWRLQTIISIVAALPGTPLWLVSGYSNSFNSVNKYWMPVMWFVPGLITMELTTLGFAYLQLRQYIENEREKIKALVDFDEKYINRLEENGISGVGSILTRSTDTKRSRRMYSTESLEECLNTNYDGLQVYASTHELNGENIMFLVKVISFKNQCESAYSHCTDLARVETTLYRSALRIFVSLVHARTAKYPINIESTLYNTLNAVFGEATELVASKRTNSMVSAQSCVTPWDEPPPTTPSTNGKPAPESFRMVTVVPTMPKMPTMPTTPTTPTTPNRQSTSNESSDHIISPGIPTGDATDPLADFPIPAGFNDKIFDETYKKVRYTVWSGTWQRYMEGKRAAATV